MAEKKQVTPKDPEADSAKDDEDRTTERKSQGFRYGGRKMARKSSSYRFGG